MNGSIDVIQRNLMNDTARSQHVTQKEQDLNGRTVDEVHNLVLVVFWCGGSPTTDSDPISQSVSVLSVSDS